MYVRTYMYVCMNVCTCMYNCTIYVHMMYVYMYIVYIRICTYDVCICTYDVCIYVHMMYVFVYRMNGDINDLSMCHTPSVYPSIALYPIKRYIYVHICT